MGKKREKMGMEKERRGRLIKHELVWGKRGKGRKEGILKQ